MIRQPPPRYLERRGSAMGLLHSDDAEVYGSNVIKYNNGKINGSVLQRIRKNMETKLEAMQDRIDDLPKKASGQKKINKNQQEGKIRNDKNHDTGCDGSSWFSMDTFNDDPFQEDLSFLEEEDENVKEQYFTDANIFENSGVIQFSVSLSAAEEGESNNRRFMEGPITILTSQEDKNDVIQANSKSNIGTIVLESPTKEYSDMASQDETRPPVEVSDPFPSQEIDVPLSVVANLDKGNMKSKVIGKSRKSRVRRSKFICDSHAKAESLNETFLEEELFAEGMRDSQRIKVPSKASRAKPDLGSDSQQFGEEVGNNQSIRIRSKASRRNSSSLQHEEENHQEQHHRRSRSSSRGSCRRSRLSTSEERAQQRRSIRSRSSSNSRQSMTRMSFSQEEGDDRDVPTRSRALSRSSHDRSSYRSFEQSSDDLSKACQSLHVVF